MVTVTAIKWLSQVPLLPLRVEVEAYQPMTHIDLKFDLILILMGQDNNYNFEVVDRKDISFVT